jgi:hypothetical protein
MVKEQNWCYLSSDAVLNVQLELAIEQVLLHGLDALRGIVFLKTRIMNKNHCVQYSLH